MSVPKQEFQYGSFFGFYDSDNCSVASQNLAVNTFIKILFEEKLIC